MSPTRSLILLAGLLSIAGCKDGGSSDGDDTATDDTGDYVPESGCIVVDGGSGYALLQDAHDRAPEGGVITMDDCGSMDQSVTITKSLVIQGPGSTTFTWDAPVNEPAISIEGAGQVDISGLTFTSTRNGVEAADSSVSFTDVAFVGIANTAIKATDSDLSVTESTFTAPAYGGVDLDGGSVTVERSTFTDAIGFAVKATGGAGMSLTENSISGVVYTNADDGLVDGFAVWGEDIGTATLRDNVFDNNVIAVFVQQGNLDVDGDTYTGGLYGIYGLLGEITVSNVTVTDAYIQGLYLVAQDDIVTLTDSVVSGDPLLTYTTTDPDGWTGGAVTLASDTEMVVSNVDVSGYNAQGLALLPYADGSTPLVTVTDTTVDNSGRYGLLISGADATMTNVDITGMRLADDPDQVNVGGNYSVGFMAYFIETDLIWDGGSLMDSEVIGALVRSSTAEIRNIETGGHGFIGVWSYESSLVMEDSTITQSPGSGGIANYYGDALIQNNTFIENTATTESSYSSYSYVFGGSDATYDSGSNTFSDIDGNFLTNGAESGHMLYAYDYGAYNYIDTVDSETEMTVTDTWSTSSAGTSFAVYAITDVTSKYSHGSQDLVSSAGTSFEVANNTFEDGSSGIYVSGGSNISIHDNSFVDYHSYVLQLYSTESDTIEVSDITMENVGAYPVYCYGATVELKDLSIDGVIGASTTVESYTDGELTSSYSYTSTGEAIYSYGCNLTMEDVEISNAAYHSVETRESNLEIYGLKVDGGSESGSSSYGAVHMEWSSDVEPFALVSGLEVSNVSTAAGITMVGERTATAPTLFLDSIEVDSVGGHCLDIYGLGALELASASLTNCAGDGLTASLTTMSVDALTVSGAGSYGLEMSGNNDADEDGYTIGEGDCNDGDYDVNPGADDSDTNGVDDNCDGIADAGTDTTDNDGDGYSEADGDCDDTNYYINPTGDEGYTINVDDDCDGIADNGLDTTLSVVNSSFSGNGSNGMDIQLTDFTVTDNSSTDNGGYGMQCTDSTRVSCENNTLTGNTSGRQSGCGSVCVAD